jgi:hypothetical protein
MDPLPPPPPAAVVRIERTVAPIAFPDPALETVLETVLRGQLAPSGSTPGACAHQGVVRYIFNRLDLDGDRQPETLVALLGRRHCASHGCPLLILKSLGDQLIPLQAIEGFHHSLVVSERRSQGWLDLVLPQDPGDGMAPPRVLSHTGEAYPAGSGASADQVLPARGVAALVLKPSPYAVQGHPLTCPPARGTQRNRVLSKVPTARPRSSPPPGAAAGEAPRPEPAVWVATKLMSPQRKMPVTP